MGRDLDNLKEWEREHYKKNRDRILANRRARYKKNPEKMKESNNKYREKNRKLLNAKQALFRANNPGYFKGRRQNRIGRKRPEIKSIMDSIRICEVPKSKDKLNHQISVLKKELNKLEISA